VKRSRSLLRVGVLVGTVVLAAALAGVASGAPDQSLVTKLKDNARGSVTVSVRAGTGAASFVKAGQNGDLMPADKAAPKGKALGFWKNYGAIMGVGDESTLTETSSTTDAYGATHITYQQYYKGVPVFGALLKAHIDKDGNLTGVNGVGVPNISLDTNARLSAADAARNAIAEVVADPPTDASTGRADKLTASELSTPTTTLYVYRMGLVRGDAGSNQLVYQVEVTNGSDVREFVFVHAQAGKIVNRYSAASEPMLHRVVYEKVFDAASKIWEEGDAFPGALNVDQQNIVNFSGQAYGFFFNTFGRDSYDGAGHTMSTVNNDPRINCPNANWNGITTNYCNGVTADDVVAHEWGHAYTEFTDGLIYQWQPGALNESYSDIWGETVDQLNGVQTDTPATTRTPKTCTTHTVPVPILIINAPTPGTCAAGSAAFGPPLTLAGTSGDLVYIGRGCDPAYQVGQPLDPYLANPAGKVALIDRGSCTFTSKVKKAQDNGAIAVVAANLPGGGAFGLGGGDPTITIPSLGISNVNGNLLKGYITQGTTNVTLKLAGGAATPEDSYKWLLSEDATAFNTGAPPGGHAIRDMWDPTCLADPGKVTDAEYQCDVSDAGGVHTNSGVPNHGYALLADGGAYNGQTILGIGLTKAAHIYWRAQSVYQGPASGFDDHADALEASCQDLIGQPLNALSLTSSGPSGQTITAGDCAQVTAMIAAVELRHDPTQQCGFKPLLDLNTPQLCPGAQKNPSQLYTEDFEGGLGGWTLSNQGKYTGWQGDNWVANGSLPKGRSGTAAYAKDLDGQCDQGAGDRSGVMMLTSPSIELPAAAIQSPRLTFMQYVATELNVDGGNLKMSVNGGPYTLVPGTAYTFNKYTGTLALAPANTNPMQGQEAFSGTDGGQVFGTWGQSQIDLTKAGVKPGDTIQLRFDFGMDGCGAIDGWYIDDVKVSACNTKKAPAAASASFAETVYRRD